MSPHRRRRAAREVASITAGAALVAVLAQLSVTVPGTPVPITGQSLGVVLAGAALGSLRGAGAMLLYAAAGFLGLPLFAKVEGGATLGYLLAFVPAAALCGWLVERFAADRRWLGAAATAVAGQGLILLGGASWLMAGMDLAFLQAWQWGVQPFLLGAALKSALAATLLWIAWRRVGEGPRVPLPP